MTQLKNPWQTALINAVTQPEELLKLLELDTRLLHSTEIAASAFPLKVPRGFIARMQKGNINDPLLRQVLPLGIELQHVAGFTKDPLQESSTNPVPGLLHKYHGRVLLTPTGICGINCRYCFRRHFPYDENNPSTAGWQKAFDYVAQNKTIIEVILSGGDPLIMNDMLLHSLTQKLAQISHLKRLRIHSRLPIVLPERITADLINSILHPTLKTVLVTHCNHSQEINDEVIQAMHMLTRAGITLLNQTVLLKGINDDVTTLVNLSEALFAAGIQPYYLHLLDKIQGAAHFDLERSHAQQLHWQLAGQLSGYLVPKLVCEQPGAPAKITIIL